MLTHHLSDSHRLGHEPFRRCCLLKESLPHLGRSPLPKPCLRREALLPRPPLRVWLQVQLTVLDWDKLSANDLWSEELIKAAPKSDGETELYAVDVEEEGVEKGMRVFWLELATVGNLPGGVKPAIQFRYIFLFFDCSLTPTHPFVHPGHSITPMTPCGSISGDTASPSTLSPSRTYHYARLVRLRIEPS